MFKLSFFFLVAVVTGAPAGALVHETAVSQSDNAMPDIPVQLRAELQAEVDVAETALAQEKTALQEAKSAAASAEADMETKQNAIKGRGLRKLKATHKWKKAKEKFEKLKKIEEEVQTAYDDAKAELDAAKSLYKYNIETGPCGLGEYKVAANDYDGITSCKECPEKENLDHVELHFDTECQACPMGSKLVGEEDCSASGGGSRGRADPCKWRYTGCIQCAPGKYSDQVNWTWNNCKWCKPGKYTRPEDNGGFGQSECKGLCGINEESEKKSKDKSACYKCPAGKFGTATNIGHPCEYCSYPTQHPNCASM